MCVFFHAHMFYWRTCLTRNLSDTYEQLKSLQICPMTCHAWAIRKNTFSQNNSKYAHDYWIVDWMFIIRVIARLDKGILIRKHRSAIHTIRLYCLVSRASLCETSMCAGADWLWRRMKPMPSRNQRSGRWATPRHLFYILSVLEHVATVW